MDEFNIDEVYLISCPSKAKNGLTQTGMTKEMWETLGVSEKDGEESRRVINGEVDLFFEFVVQF